MASIYPNTKDGKIVSFKLKAFLGRDENGKQIIKCKTWTPEKSLSEKKLLQLAQKEAAIWERQATEQFKEEREKITSVRITFSDFVYKIWFPSQMNEKEYRASTIAFHTHLLKIIVPYLGKFQINKITSTHIQGYLDYLKNNYKTKDNRALSTKTIKHHYSTLSLIFKYAEKTGYIKINPLNKVETPRLIKHKVDALSKGETLVFFRELEKLPLMYRTIYTLLITAGLRRGECYGLQWKDIDFENHIVSIERNVTYTSIKGISVGLPKTENGIRKIPLTNKTVELLYGYKQEQQKHYEITDDTFVFPSLESPVQPHDPTYLTKHLKKFLKRIGLPDMSPHDLRHTCASILLQSGADIKSVQDILGHADASTTLNFYVRSDLESIRGATERAFEFY